MQGGKGEAVVSYREPFPTQQMGYHRLSQRVNKIEKKALSSLYLDIAYKSNHMLELEADSQGL